MTVTKKATKSGPGRAVGKKHYSDKERGAALALLDFYSDKRNRFQLVTKATGVSRNTLTDWVAGRAVNQDVKDARAEGNSRIALALENTILQLSTITVDAARAAAKKGKVRDVALANAITVDKRNLILNKPSEITLTLTGDEKTQTEQEQFESLVQRVIAAEKEQGREVSRNEAAAKVIEFRPQYARLYAVESKPPQPPVPVATEKAS